MKCYAEYNPYGVRVAYESIGWQFVAFDSKKERAAWLDLVEWDDCNLIAEECSRRTVEKNLGRNFKISGGVCYGAHDLEPYPDESICILRNKI